MSLLRDIMAVTHDLVELMNSDGAHKLVADIKQAIADFRAGKLTG